MITIGDLIQFNILIVAIVGLIYQTLKKTAPVRKTLAVIFNYKLFQGAIAAAFLYNKYITASVNIQVLRSELHDISYTCRLFGVYRHTDGTLKKRR